MKMMLAGKFDLDLFSDEFNETKNKGLVSYYLSTVDVLIIKGQTEEEINKLTTNESFNPLQKAMHIMKKGYQVQKKSVNHIQSIFFGNFYSTNQVIENLDYYL